MRRGFLILSLSLAALPACGGGSTQFWLPKNNLLPMVALADRVAYVEESSGTAFVLDPADPSLTPTLTPVGKRPVLAVKHAGSNRLLVVTAGDRGSAEQAPQPAQLVVVDPASPAAPAAYALDSRFDGLAQSGDGRFAVLYHTSSAQDANDGALFNPNDMVVADFGDTPTGAPTVTPKSIRSLGGVPTSPSSSPIQFSPVYNFQGGPRRLAVILSQNYVTIFDLIHLDRNEISVPLCPASGTCNYGVAQVVFDPANANIYVRATGAQDIFQISLTDLGPGAATGGSNDFLASLSMLAVGSPAADMALYGTGADARLAVVAPNTRSLVLIDPTTSRSVAVTMAIPATKIVPFTLPSQDPSTNKPRNQAMLVDLQQGSSSVLFADFGLVETAGGLPLSQYSIRGGATDVVPLVSQGLALLLFDKSAGGAVLSVVDLANRSFFDFNSSSALGSPYLEVRNGGLASRLWNVDSPDNGQPSNDSGIHYLDVAAGGSQSHPTIWLDQTITSITALAAPSSDGHRYLVLGQSDPNQYGNLTLLDADHPDRATARTAYGFLFTNYLGRNQP